MVGENNGTFQLTLTYCKKHDEYYFRQCGFCAVEEARVQVEREVAIEIITWLKKYRTKLGYIGINLDSKLWREFEASLLGAKGEVNEKVSR